MKKQQILEILKELETDLEENQLKYMNYEEGKYDADYYLFLGITTGLGQAIDLFESKLKELG